MRTVGVGDGGVGWYLFGWRDGRVLTCGGVASAGNKIGDEGAKCLADALLTNSSLQTLDLEGAYGGRGGEAGHR
jgi:hypothetical protein